MTTREELVSLRKEFEQYYVTHAFNYAANPIGSRDCSVMWEGYKAGAASRDAEIHHLQMALADTEALELGTAEKCDQLREQVALLREEVTRCRNWFEAQAKVKSKGSPSSWEFMLLRDERDAADEALAATEPKP